MRVEKDLETEEDNKKDRKKRKIKSIFCTPRHRHAFAAK